MDDREFDKKIREKTEGLSPAYKESAWQRLEQRLTALPPIPWYQKWGGWLFGGGMGLLTLLNLTILWQTHQEKEKLSDMLPPVDSTFHQTFYYYDTIYVRDTVYLQRQEAFPQPAIGMKGIVGGGLVQHENENLQWAIRLPVSKLPIGFPSLISGKALSGSGQNTGISPSFLSGSSDISLTSSEDYRYISSGLQPVLPTHPAIASTLTNLPTGIVSVNHLWYDEREARQEFQQKNPLQLRAGIGAGFAIPDPDIGRRFMNGQQNLGVELYFKKQLNSRLFTGITHHKLHYILEGVHQRELYDREDLNKYPGFETLERLPETIEVENQLLHFPLHFRYYVPLNYEWSVFAGAGVGLDFLINQKFSYGFLDVENGQIMGYEDIIIIHNNQLHFGSLDGTLGIQYLAGKKLGLQTNISYRYGFGRIGVEERAMDVLNFNLGLWWQLK